MHEGQTDANGLPKAHNHRFTKEHKTNFYTMKFIKEFKTAPTIFQERWNTEITLIGLYM